jgi:hypothetical protein
LDQERAESPDTRRGYRRPPGEPEGTQPGIGECCIRHRRLPPWQDLHTINRLLNRAAGCCRQTSCECCAQVFGKGVVRFCGCTATRASQMFCRACWDKYSADKKPAEIKDRRALLTEGFCSNDSCACCRPSFDGRFCSREVVVGSGRCKNCQ